MKLKSITTVALGVALAGPAVAVEPNINPGMWETTSSVALKSAQFSMPTRSETTNECVTAEKITEGQAFIDNKGECVFSKKDMRADGMDYVMTCDTGEGGTIAMNASMQFNGETMTGTVDGTMGTPMGEMNMTITLSGKRTGNCTP